MVQKLANLCEFSHNVGRKLAKRFENMNPPCVCPKYGQQLDGFNTWDIYLCARLPCTCALATGWRLMPSIQVRASILLYLFTQS